MSKKVEDDASILITYAKELGLTDVEFVRENILHPQPDFVITFYQSVFKWINAKLSELGFDKYDYEDTGVKQSGAEFGPEIQLCAQVYDLLEQIGVDYFSINDVLSSKLPFMRTKVFFKCLLSFLMYMNDEIGNGKECSEILTEYISNEGRMRSLEMQKEELIEDINMKSESHALEELKLKRLQEELKINKEKLEKVQKHKKECEEIDRKSQAELDKYIDVLTHKAEYLKMLNVQEQDLQKKVVSAEEHQALKDIVESCKQEIAELEREDSCHTRHEELKNTCKYYTDVIETVEGLNFKTLQIVDIVHGVNKQIKEFQKQCDVLNTEIKTHESATVKAKDDIRSIEEEKQTHLIQHKAMKEGLIKDIEVHKQLKEEHQKQFENVIMIAGKVKREINKSEEEYSLLQSNEALLQEHLNNNYRKLLNVESRVIVLLYDSLAKIERALSNK